MFLRIGLAGLLVAAGLSTAACTDGYGYSGVNVGVGNGGYYDGYGGYGSYAGYPGYGYGAGPGYFGWYGDYYYPGTGINVYDRDRRRHRWNDGQRRYWEGRRGVQAGNGAFRDNWAGFRGNGWPGPQAYRDRSSGTGQVREARRERGVGRPAGQGGFRSRNGGGRRGRP